MIETVKAVIIILVAAGGIFCNVPVLINYPGKLTEKNGSPVTGVKTIKFAFYDSETAGSEKWSGSYPVTVNKGVFNVLLGSASSPFSANLDFSSNYWIQMTVEGELLSPRQKISSVAYALRSEYANRADTPMVISGRADVDANVSEKLYFILDKMPRSIKLFLYGEKYNEQYYTELAGHNHNGTTSDYSNGHTHTVDHTHAIVCEWGTSTRIWGADEASFKNQNGFLIVNANPTSSGASAGHTHTYTSSLTGVVSKPVSTVQKMYLNDLKVYQDGENISNEITSTVASRAGLAKLGDGTEGHVLNSVTGTGAVNVTDLFSTTGQHYIVFKQTGLNQGGRLKYYLYVNY